MKGAKCIKIIMHEYPTTFLVTLNIKNGGKNKRKQKHIKI